MFDTVSSPESRPRRRGVALFLSLGVNTLMVGSLFLVQPPDAPAADPVEEVEYAPVMLVPVRAAPPAPAPAGGGRARSARPVAAVPPPVPSAPPVSLPEPSPAIVADAGGSGAGPDDGGPPGSGLGPGDGGGGGGGGGGGARTVHWSEVQARVQHSPEYPRAAAALGFTDPQDCILRLEIDPRGVPVAVRVRRCHAVFADVATEAAFAWRFYPLVQDGVPVASQFDLNFKFRPH